MADEPDFAAAGTKTEDINVQLSYTIIDLLSKEHYSSPNKAIEELVSNSFDAGAQNVNVLFLPDLDSPDATIVVIDDGEGMDNNALKMHWRIGESDKRGPSNQPPERTPIGKFGIGKLATYVLANRLTHISKRGKQYYSTSMDYSRITKSDTSHAKSEELIKIPLHILTEEEAKQAVRQWTESPEFKAANMRLFGDGSLNSWTISIMSDLKNKAHDIRYGRLRWVLRTAMPLRPDFDVWLRGEQLQPSKINKELLEKWVIGKDLVDLHRDALEGIEESFDENLPAEHQHAIVVPELGRVTGYVEAYKEKLTDSSSDRIGHSHGFFVYVYGRLVNLDDDHFGILSNELRHGTFVCFRAVVHMNGLDEDLRSNHESIGEGPKLDQAQEVLRAIFNIARNRIEEYDRSERPGTKLASKLAASPASLSRKPIVDLARAVAKGDKKSHYLIVPSHTSDDDRKAFLDDLGQRALEAKQFITGVDITQDGLLHGVAFRFDTASGRLKLNRFHPLVDTFRSEFTSKGMGQPLELFAMAEVLTEAHLHSIGVRQKKIDEFVSLRDQLLRDLANTSGRLSASSVAEDLLNASNRATPLEERVVDAFKILGFEAEHLGGSNEPDGVATAHLSPINRIQRRYKVCLEAKSTRSGRGKVSARDVDISGVIRHRREYECDHVLVVGPGFSASDYESVLGREIQVDRDNTRDAGTPRTITLIEIVKLAHLIQLRHVKQITLSKIRNLFQTCGLPQESAAWIESIRSLPDQNPLEHRSVIETIGTLQKQLEEDPVTYHSLQVKLQAEDPSTPYRSKAKVKAVCQAMQALAPNSITITLNTVRLEQGVGAVIEDIKYNMEKLTGYSGNDDKQRQ